MSDFFFILTRDSLHKVKRLMVASLRELYFQVGKTNALMMHGEKLLINLSSGSLAVIKLKNVRDDCGTFIDDNRRFIQKVLLLASECFIYVCYYRDIVIKEKIL